MKIFLLLLIFLCNCGLVLSQKVGRYPPRVTIENFNTINSDGIICFEIDVRVSDCIAYVELIDLSEYKENKNIIDKIHDWWWFKVLKIYNFETEKKIRKEIDIENYSLRETSDNSELIVMKTEIISLKSLFGRKLQKDVRIDVYSLSSKIIFSKKYHFDKIKLIESIIE